MLYFLSFKFKIIMINTTEGLLFRKIYVLLYYNEGNIGRTSFNSFIDI